MCWALSPHTSWHNTCTYVYTSWHNTCIYIYYTSWHNTCTCSTSWHNTCTYTYIYVSHDTIHVNILPHGTIYKHMFYMYFMAQYDMFYYNIHVHVFPSYTFPHPASHMECHVLCWLYLIAVAIATTQMCKHNHQVNWSSWRQQQTPPLQQSSHYLCCLSLLIHCGVRQTASCSGMHTYIVRSYCRSRSQ